MAYPNMWEFRYFTRSQIEAGRRYASKLRSAGYLVETIDSPKLRNKQIGLWVLSVLPGVYQRISDRCTFREQDGKVYAA